MISKNENITIRIDSAYRSVGLQEELMKELSFCGDFTLYRKRMCSFLNLHHFTDIIQAADLKESKSQNRIQKMKCTFKFLAITKKSGNI